MTSLLSLSLYLWKLRVGRGRGRQAAVRVGQIAGVQGTLRVLAVIRPAVAAHVQVAVSVGNTLRQFSESQFSETFTLNID